jgi:hypothetical protein
MPKKKPSTYNKILKQFTKINNKLPADRKLSISERRKAIKELIAPKFKGVPAYKIKIKDIKASILKAYDKIPPREICDINYLDTSIYSYVEWFALDETISQLVPDCIYVKVSAGEYGDTKIFNTRDYQYGRNGVRTIVEAIRVDADQYPSGKYLFSGYKKLRPRKKNNGDPESYYLDFVLFIEDKKGNKKPQADATVVDYELPKNVETKKKKTKIKNIIEGRIKKLKQQADSKRRAKKTLKKNLEDLKRKATSARKTKKPSPIKVASRDKQFIKTSALLEKYLKEGKLTQNQYDVALDRLLRDYEK